MKTYAIIALITMCFSIVDVLTGYLGAVLKNAVSSSKMRSGLAKKGVILLVMATAMLLQWAQTVVDLGISIPIVSVVAAFLILMETTSILENANIILDGRISNLISSILPGGKDNDSK